MLTRCFSTLENSLYNAVQKLRKDERGITAIEYAALAVGLAALIITLTGDDGEISKAIKSAFENVSDQLSKG